MWKSSALPVNFSDDPIIAKGLPQGFMEEGHIY